MIDLMPDAEQRQIVESVVEVLDSRCHVDRLRDRAAPAGAVERREWKRFAALGWFGLGLPTALGGVGCTLAEEVLVFREFGRFVLSPSVLAASVAAQIAAHAGQRELAAAILDGSERPALAVPAGPSGTFELSARAAAGELHLVEALEVNLLTVWTEEGAALLRRRDLVAVETVDAMDATVTLERATAEGAAPVAFVAAQDVPLPLRAQMLIAAQLVGMAEAARDLAADYAKLREQFGKPIGAFQAIGHHCANMAVRAEAAWAQARFAALAARDRRDDAVFQVSAANLVAAGAAFDNATMAIRVHGGIGYTADCPAHHYLKRTILWRRAAGGARLHESRLLAQAAAN